MELNRDEVRRQLNDIDRAHRESERDDQLFTSMLLEGVDSDALRRLPQIDRRNFLRIGGIAVAGTTLLAACREAKPKEQVPLSGQNPGYSAPANKNVDDHVLLRTAASLELTLVDAYRRMMDNDFAMDAALAEMIKLFSAHHTEHAAALGDTVKQMGGAPCTNLNSKITSYMVEPLLVRISTAGEQQAEDVKAFAFALESLATATYQGVVPVLTQPALRKAAMSIGAVEARHAALLGVLINPNALVAGAAAAEPAQGDSETTDTTGAATATTVQMAYEANSIHAIPSAFGTLAPYVLTVGTANENGVRPSMNLETPSLNSFIYDDEAC